MGPNFNSHTKTWLEPGSNNQVHASNWPRRSKLSKQQTKCAIHPCDGQKTSKQQAKCAFHGIALKKKHLRASPSPHGPKKLLYFRMEYGLMITAPTHKRHKSPFKHSKTIYVFTSVWAIVTLHVHGGRKLLKGVKMTTAKWTTNTGEKQDLRYPAERFNEKGRLLVWGGHAQKMWYMEGLACTCK